jgi:hypothetical protein
MLQHSDDNEGSFTRYSDSFDIMYITLDGIDYAVELVSQSNVGEIFILKENNVERFRVTTEFLDPIYASDFTPGLRFTSGSCGVTSGIPGTPIEYLMGINGTWTDSCGDYGVVVDGNEICTDANGSTQGLFDGVVCWMRTSRSRQGELIGRTSKISNEYIVVYGEDDNPGYWRSNDLTILP